ncbi:TonB-dependent receptor [Massilia sp. PAMC28688]|uniref:TonB-dependent receptor plug domain-containing protein n=1 Tax=Massilia sp. PAMC28688 TaxID=2861283 RepID=UPI001C62A844|nr:TonB-dependent receptor [Massilia sp. PAMC28688]QYF95583.1 TonB-dependent receptor [Massilia sp. PAMC28688]
MTKATAIHIAVLMLCSGVAAAQDTSAPQAAPAPVAAEASTDDVQKVTIVATGSRGSQRTVVDAAVPVDILAAKELTKSGQYTLDKALGFRVPSFNTVQTPVNDATSMLDPYEIRNMGPSRALILINGKRKNSSALVYAQTSPGRGESGSDISAISPDAIKRIEVLRDGASAQYGSDAIAGVVNIILKDSPTEGAMTLRAGVTGEGDGKMGAISINNGMSLNGRGFVNYTLDVSKVGLASRSGPLSVGGEAATFGVSEEEVRRFLDVYPDGRNINGSPETKAAKILVNAGIDLEDGQRAYGNFAYMRKDVNSFANYRTPYWQPTDSGKLTPAGSPYIGYGPTLDGKLTDFNGTAGIKGEMMGWSSDISITFGGNEQNYLVGNTVNQRMGAASPTSFSGGGVNFYHTVFNADLSKQITDKVNVYYGAEARWEQFEVEAGDAASYENGGADSYVGNEARNAGTFNRRNYGAYVGSNIDITERFLVDITGRYENYSDFGNATVGKLSSRFKLNDKVTLRGSLSSGFRAPSLHQIYTQKAQYSFVAGEGIKVSGLVNNVSPAARLLEVERLKAEKSKSLTLGLGVQPDRNTSMTLDYYNIEMKDRIVLGNEIYRTDPTIPGSKVDATLDTLDLVSLSYFSNALDSKTSGVDYVFSRKNMSLAGGKATFNWSGNYTLKNERKGKVNDIPDVAASGQSVLDVTQEALIFTSRPKHKNIIGVDLDYAKVNFSLNNTVFGPTTFYQAGIDPDLKTEFKTRTVTDFAINYNINERMTLTFNVNNVFDVKPKWEFKALNAAGQAKLDSTAIVDYGTFRQEQSDLITFNGRYPITTYDGSHFSQLGRIFNVALSYRF